MNNFVYAFLTSTFILIMLALIFQFRNFLLQKKISKDQEKFYKKFEQLVSSLFLTKKIVYIVDKEWKYIEKCNKCNENRQVEAVVNDGSKFFVDCSCKRARYFYNIKKFHSKDLVSKIIDIRITKEGYLLFDGYNAYERIIDKESDDAYNNRYDKLMFLHKEQAEKYAEIMNKRQEEYLNGRK